MTPEAAQLTAHDPSTVTNRLELGQRLTMLRERAGLTVREVVEESGALHGTVTGWFAGQHVPTKASAGMFNDVLTVLGIEEAERDAWWEAVSRSRRAPGPRTDKAPYKGLDSFTESDASLFFGRSDLVRDAVARLSPIRPLVIVGASGSGKSSLIRAGLIPALPKDLKPVVIMPGSSPLAALQSVEIDSHTVLCIDQFEETWSLCRDNDDRAKFLNTLLTLPASPRIVIGLRADFYANALDEPLLLEPLRGNCLLVGPLSSDALESAIRRPATDTGYVIDDELVRVLLDDLSPRDSARTHDPGALPLLSHALLSTWSLAQRKRMTVAAYQATGGIKGAVEQSAERAFSDLNVDHQLIARNVFRRLVAIDGPAETRRRVKLAELLDVDSADEVSDVVGTFADHRLLTLTEETVEITHEVLLSQWKRLRTWTQDEKDGLVVHRRLTVAALLWDESGRDDSMLLGGGRLEVFSQWAADPRNQKELNNLERNFLRESASHQAGLTAAEELRQRKLRRLNRSLAIVAVVAVVAAIAAAGAGIYASGQRSAAELSGNEAMSRQAALSSRLLRDTDPALAAQIAVAAYRIAPTIEATSALLDATSLNAPTRLLFTPGNVAARMSPDRSRLIVAGDGGTAQIYHLGSASPTLIGEFDPLSGEGDIFAVAYSPDGRFVAIGGVDGIAVWQVDTDNPKFITTLDASVADGKTVYKAAFSPDGSILAVGAQDASVLRWDLTDPANPVPLPPLPADGELLHTHAALSFSADGQRMASSTGANGVTLWDVSTPEPTVLSKVMLPVDRPVTPWAVAISPDGTKLATGSSGQNLYRWDITDPRQPVPLAPLTGFLSHVNDVSFTADSRRIIAASSDQTVRVFDWARELQLAEFPSPGLNTSVQLSSDERSLIATGTDGSVRLYAMPGDVLKDGDGIVFQSRFNSSRDRLLAVSGRGAPGFGVWDVKDLAHPRLLSRVDDARMVGSGAMSPDGNVVAVGGNDNQVTLYDVSNPSSPIERGRTAPGELPSFDDIRISPNGKFLTVAALGHPIAEVWDISDPAAPRYLTALTVDEGVNEQAFSPDGKTLAVSSAAGVVRMWAVDAAGTFRPIGDFGDYDGGATSVVFINDKLTAVAGLDRRTNIWDVSDAANPVKVSEFGGTGQEITSIQPSPDGNRFAISGNDEVLIWDIRDPESPRKVAQLTAAGSRVYSTHFLADSSSVVGSGSAKNFRLWQTDPDRAAAEICAERGSGITEEEWADQLIGIAFFDPCE